MRKIKVNLFDPSSIDNAVNLLRDYARKVRRAESRIEKELAILGAEVVDIQYSIIPYQDYEVNYYRTSEGYVIEAVGDSVVFLEFGTGQDTDSAYGSSEGFTFVEPGMWSQTWGKGQYKPGIHERWRHEGKVYTGTESVKGFYFAKREMRDQAVKIIRKVLKEL